MNKLVCSETTLTILRVIQMTLEVLLGKATLRDCTIQNSTVRATVIMMRPGLDGSPQEALIRAEFAVPLDLTDKLSSHYPMHFRLGDDMMEGPHIAWFDHDFRSVKVWRRFGSKGVGFIGSSANDRTTLLGEGATDGLIFEI